MLRLSSSSIHAVTNTPTEPQAARFVRFTCDCGLPRIVAGSASVSFFSRTDQCSHYITACMVAKPLKGLLHRRLQPIRYLHDCSSCYRLKRKLPGGIRSR